MRIAAVNNANLYLKTNSKNENLKSNSKFYSNSVQPNDKFTFTSKTSLLPSKYEDKIIDIILYGEKCGLFGLFRGKKYGMFTKINDQFVPVDDIKTFAANASRIEEIVLKQPDEYQQSLILDILGNSEKYRLLERLISVKENGTKPNLLQIIGLPISRPMKKIAFEKLIKILSEDSDILNNPEKLSKKIKDCKISGFYFRKVDEQSSHLDEVCSNFNAPLLKFKLFNI